MPFRFQLKTEFTDGVAALLGHSRIDTTQVYASIKPPQLKRAVGFYEAKAVQILAP